MNTTNGDTLELSEILYAVISDEGEQRILSDIVQGESSYVIRNIYEQCVSKIEKISMIKSDTRMMIAEGLMHYLLTTAMIPSKRKTVFQSVDIDIAVPDTITLGTTPQEVVVILFPKTNDLDSIKSQIADIKKIQPNRNNIWIVINDEMELDAKTYTLNGDMTFANIINDLIAFTSNKKQSKLKIFKI